VTAGCFRRLANTGGDSAYSNTANATTGVVTIPSQPTNLSVVGGPSSLKLTWTDTSNNEQGFKIECSYGDKKNFGEFGR
jgi:titin